MIKIKTLEELKQIAERYDYFHDEEGTIVQEALSIENPIHDRDILVLKKMSNNRLVIPYVMIKEQYDLFVNELERLATDAFDFDARRAYRRVLVMLGELNPPKFGFGESINE